jgi:hypothetical protein
MRHWILRHRPGPVAGAAIGAAAMVGLVRLFPALGCG